MTRRTKFILAGLVAIIGIAAAAPKVGLWRNAGSVTANSVPRFSGTAGDQVKTSTLVVDDAGAMSGVTLPETLVTFTDVTTNNASASNHGFLPKLDGTATHYLLGTGAWSSGSLSIASGKTLTASNTVTLTATDGSTLAIGAGGTLGSAAYTATSAYEVPLTFSTGLTRSTNTITVNTSQNIATLSNLTNNGFVKTSGGTGALSIDTTSYAPSASPTITGHPTIEGVTSTGATGTGKFVFDTAPQISTIELGNASDTTLSRSSAGVLAVEGVAVSLNSTSATHTAGNIELGNASDTTLSRVSAGVVAIEGTNIVKAGSVTSNGVTMNTAKLLGRTTASSGAIEEITVSGATLSGGTLTISGGGTKTYARFYPADQEPTGTNDAVYTKRNRHPVLSWSGGGSTTTVAVFSGVIPEGASLGSGLIVRIPVMAATLTSGVVKYQVSFERIGTTQDIDSDSFDTATPGTVTVSGTSGTPVILSITCTTIDSLAAGEEFRMKVERLDNDAADTLGEAAQTGIIEVRSGA